MFQSIWKFISYWWFRYYLVTELYMVEKWERVVIHIFFLVVFTALSFFNLKVYLSFVEYLTKPLFETPLNSYELNSAQAIIDGGAQSSILGDL